MTRSKWQRHVETVAWAVAQLLDGRADSYNGLDLNPAGAQCVNVAGELNRALGRPAWPGNAVDWMGRGFPGAVYFPAFGGAVPLPGDVALFHGPGYSEFGHCAVVLEAVDWPNLLVWEQNDPEGTPSRIDGRSTAGLKGWQRIQQVRV